MSDLPLRRQVLSGLSGAGLLGLAPIGRARAAAASRPIRVANASGGLNLTMGALMQRMRFYEAFGLAPDILDLADGSKMVGAMINNQIDASFNSGLGQLFPAMERGADLKIIGAALVTQTIALYSAKPEIKTLKDLEGRTVGTGSIGALVHLLVVTLLRKYDVDVSKVRFVNVGSSADILKAVSVGTVDAGPGASALIDDLAKYRVHLVDHGNMSAELRGYTFQGAWTAGEQIRKQRDLLVHGLAAQAKLYRFVQTDAAKGPFIEARRSVFPNAAPEDHEAEWRFISTYKPFAVDLTLTPEKLNYLQTLNVTYKTQAKILPFSQVADMSLAADAIKLLQRMG